MMDPVTFCLGYILGMVITSIVIIALNGLGGSQ